MIDVIKQLEISDIDKNKANYLINNNEYGSEYLEDLLSTCFLILPSLYNKLSEKHGENKAYQKLIKHDNSKRSIAFKIILDKITLEDSDITPQILNRLLTSLCNYKMVTLKISIGKYKMYANTLANVNTNAIFWVEYILTSSSILNLSDREYEKIINEIKIITSNSKNGENTFDENGDWDIRKADYEQVKAYKKVLAKKKT
jgi:hypothetical protein